MGKGLLAWVKCQQRNARMSVILSVFPKPRELVSLQKSCYVAGSITSQYFPDFLNLSESCREKAVFVQHHNTSLHSKFRQTALKLTAKGLNYTQIDTWQEPCITDLWFWEVLWAKPKLIEDDANGFVKALYQFSHLWILDLLSKNQTLAHALKRDCVPLTERKWLKINKKNHFSIHSSLNVFLTFAFSLQFSPEEWGPVGHKAEPMQNGQLQKLISRSLAECLTHTHASATYVFLTSEEKITTGTFAEAAQFIPQIWTRITNF